MEILTSKTFASTLTRCRDNPHYNAAIMFADRDRQIEFLQTAKELRSGWTVNRGECKIKFKNGSYIEAIPIKPGNYFKATTLKSGNYFKGQRYHEIIFDGDYSEDEIKYAYAPMLKPYTIGQFEEDVLEDDDKLLDEFLGEFKVNN